MLPKSSFLFILAFFFLGLQLYSANQFDVSGEEAYYWTWSTQLDWGYWHHPPMIAYGIALGTLILGKNALGVRAIGIVLHILSATLLSNSTAKPIQTFLLLCTLPQVAHTGMEAHPNVYLFSFLCLSLWAFRSQKWIWLSLFFFGCILCKISAWLFIPLISLSVFTTPQYRIPLIGSLLASLFLSIPWILWISNQDAFPLGLLYETKSLSLSISLLELFFMVGTVLIAPALLPKECDQKMIWSVCLVIPLITCGILPPSFVGVALGVSGALYISVRFPSRLTTAILGCNLFLFTLQKINLHIPLLPSDVHTSHRFVGGKILADAIRAWGIEDVWTSSPFDAAWISFYSTNTAYTNAVLGTESQYDIWKKSFPLSGILVQENSRVFTIPHYFFSNLQSIAAYADGYQEGTFVLIHQWNTALFYTEESIESSSEANTPSNEAD